MHYAAFCCCSCCNLCPMAFTLKVQATAKAHRLNLSALERRNNKHLLHTFSLCLFCATVGLLEFNLSKHFTQLSGLDLCYALN